MCRPGKSTGEGTQPTAGPPRWGQPGRGRARIARWRRRPSSQRAGGRPANPRDARGTDARC
eukprot:1811779-Alexandrium_andersonii.AAC.1